MARITERSTQRIIAELEEDGYLTHETVGRRNHYKFSTTATLVCEIAREQWVVSTQTVVAFPNGSSQVAGFSFT